MADSVIPKGQRGILRLFTYDSTQAELVPVVQDPEAPTEAELARLFGLDHIPPGSVEVVRLADVSALGLRDFLIEGHDVLPDAIGPDFGWIDTLTGHVLIVHASIAAQGPIDLRGTLPGVTLVGAFAQGLAPPPPLSLPEQEKPEILGGASVPPRTQGSGVVVVVLVLLVILFLAFALLGVPIWPR